MRIDRRPRWGGVEAACVIGGLAAIAVLFTWPVAREAQRAIAGDPGDPVLNAWILAWDAERLRHALAGLWNAPIFHPYPLTLAYSENLLGIALFTAPLQWATGNAVLVYDAAFLASFVLAGGGMYVLVRMLTERRDAAALAALAYAFSPFRTAHLVHLQMLMSGWMPLGLAALHRYARSGSRRALIAFALCYLIQSLSNGYLIYFFALPVAVVIVREVLAERTTRWRRLVELTLAGACVVALLAPALHAYYRVRGEQGLVRLENEVRAFGADLGSFLYADRRVATAPLLLGHAQPEGELFPGAVIGLLVAAAFLARRRAEEAETGVESARCLWDFFTIRKRYAWIALFAAVLALGPEIRAWGRVLVPTAPYGWLMHVVPGLDGIRVPARMGVVVMLALAVLAGLGAARLFDRLAPRLRVPVAVLLGAALVLEAWPGLAETNVPNIRKRDRVVYQWLRNAPPGAAIELPYGGASLRDVPTTLRYQWQTLFHGHPIVNGYSGYASPLSRFLSGSGTPLDEPAQAQDLLEMLRDIGVRYVLVHHRPHRQREDPAVAVLAATEGQIAKQEELGFVTVLTLAPAAATPPAEDARATRVPSGAMSAFASNARGPVADLVDGDPATRWRTYGPQRGDEWLRIELDRPRTLSRVELVMTQHAVADYPRVLAIEAETSEGARELFRGGVLVPLVRSLTTPPASPSISIPLPPTTTQRLELRQLGRSSPTARWTIHDIRLWEIAQ